MTEKTLYLASTSPRRIELLNQLRLAFQTLSVNINETARPDERADAFVRRMAIEKARTGLAQLDNPNPKTTWVLGGDTLVKVDELILGKPKSKEDAFEMWRRLSGKRHQVLSAIALAYQGELLCKLNQTHVYVKNLSKNEMNQSWESGEPLGKAGGYAIQGLGARFIERIEGSYSAVMGLPIYELDELLNQTNFYER